MIPAAIEIIIVSLLILSFISPITSLKKCGLTAKNKILDFSATSEFTNVVFTLKSFLIFSDEFSLFVETIISSLLISLDLSNALIIALPIFPQPIMPIFLFIQHPTTI